MSDIMTAAWSTLCVPEPVVGEIIDEPIVAVLRDDLLAGLVAGAGIERRVRQLHGFQRQALVIHGVELAVKIERVLLPQSAQNLHELVHAAIARIVVRRPPALAEGLEFLLPPAVDDIDGCTSAADAIERDRELGDRLRRDDARMHRDHQLDSAGDRRERGSQQPGGMIRPHPTLRNQRRLEAELFAPPQHVDGKAECLVGSVGETAGARFTDRLVHQRFRPNCMRQRCPDPVSHVLPHNGRSRGATSSANSCVLSGSSGNGPSLRRNIRTGPCPKRR